MPIITVGRTMVASGNTSSTAFSPSACGALQYIELDMEGFYRRSSDCAQEHSCKPYCRTYRSQHLSDSVCHADVAAC